MMDNDKEKIAVWLDPEDIDFLIKEWQEHSESRSESKAERWGHIAYKLNVALFSNDEKID